MARGAIVKRGRTYHIVYRLDGQQKWRAIGPNKKEAEAALAEIMRAIHRSEYQEPKDITFKDFAKVWLSDYASVKVRRSTYTFYETILRLHLIKHFGDKPLKRISTHGIESYLAEKLKEGQLSATTIGYHLRVLKTVLKRAVLWGYLRSNPADSIEKPKARKAEMDFLSPEEIKLFLAQVDKDYYALFLMAILTGMRRGELLGLKWGDIDWNSGLVFVRRSLWRGQLVSTKSERAARAIVMSPKLAKTLKLHKLATLGSDLDLIFCNTDGKPLDPDSLVRNQFHPALRRAGLRKIRFHDLRHTFTSLLIYQGENIKFIQAQLGHASIQTTLDRYGHLLPEGNREAGERLDSLVFGNSVSKLLAKSPEK